MYKRKDGIFYILLTPVILSYFEIVIYIEGLT